MDPGSWRWYDVVVAKESIDKIKVVAYVSDPRPLSDDDLIRIEAESRRLSDEFEARTASMERLTADDLKIRVK